MHDFGELVYLDLQKTGSTYTSRFLRHSVVLEERKYVKHDWIREDFQPGACYFITVRHPLSLYSSLYRYGLDGKGHIFGLLKSRGFLDAYKSFESFLAFMTDPKNAIHLSFGYTEEIARQVGFMSFRYLKMSLQFPMKKINPLLKRGKPLSSLRNKFITSYVLKNENLTEELRNFANNLEPNYFDINKANDWLDNAGKLNQSKTSTAVAETRSKELIELIDSKESLLLAHYDEGSLAENKMGWWRGGKRAWW